MTQATAPATFSTRAPMSTAGDDNGPQRAALGDAAADDDADLIDLGDWRPRVLASSWLGWDRCSCCGKPAVKIRKCLPCFEDERRATNTMGGGVVSTVQKHLQRGNA